MDTMTDALKGPPAWWLSALRMRLVLGAILVALAAFAGPAHAQFDAPVAIDVRVAGDDNASRIIIDFDRPIDVTTQLLDHPWRLVLDFPQIGYGFKQDESSWTGLARDMRWGDMNDDHSRMIFEMQRPFSVSGVSVVEAGNRHSVIIDILAVEDSAFKAALVDQMRTASVVVQNSKTDRLGARSATQARSSDTFVLVLDAGHGGIDSGAIGRHSTNEKDIVLAFAKQLQEEMSAYDGVDVKMTRDSDVFLPLNERVQIARQHNASLFISLHADSIREKDVRGATVYTISEKASDSVAASIAESENLSDAIAGINFEDEPGDVADILVDLARRETLGFSVQFARLVVSSVQDATKMIKNPHRFAGFRVLRAPDVPSVLVELGYLSNSDDEAQLKDEKWRQQVAAKLAQAIARFAELSGHAVAQRTAQ